MIVDLNTEESLRAPELSDNNLNVSISNFAGEAINAALYAAAVEPARGTAQFCDQLAGTHIDAKVKAISDFVGIEAPRPAEFGTSGWYAQQFGGAAGMMVPFKFIHHGVKLGAGNFLHETSGSSCLRTLHDGGDVLGLAKQNAAILGTSGMIYGTFLKPSDESHVGQKGFYVDRLTNGVSDLAAFGSMGFASPYIGRGCSALAGTVERSSLGLPYKASLSGVLNGPIVTGVASGLTGGLVNAEVGAWRDLRPFATAAELKENMVGMGIVGGAFSIVHQSGFGSVERQAGAVKPPVGPRLGAALASGDIVGQTGEIQYSVSPPEHDRLRLIDELNADTNAAKLSWIFGDKGPAWVEYASPYLGAAAALKVLPVPSAEGKDGLARYFVNEVKNISDPEEITQLKEIGRNWSKVEKEDLVMPISELFFKVKTGKTLTEYLKAPDSALSIVPVESDRPDFCLLKASIGNAKVGMSMFHLEPPFLHVDNIEVEPGFRRYGIGTQLLSKIEQSIGPEITKISLDVNQLNTRARKFYAKLGFAFVNETSDGWSTLAKPVATELRQFRLTNT